MNLNKAILIGRLGQDPEFRATPSGQSVVNFSIATTERWKGKDGEKQEKTEWHRIVAWGKTAENCSQYLRKGNPVYVEGKIGTEQWADKDGVKKTTIKITADSVIFLGGAPSDGQQRQPQNEPPRATQHNDTFSTGEIF